MASRRFEGLALATPFRAPCHQPSLLDPSVSLLGVLAVNGHVIRDPARGRAARVCEDAPRIGDPDAAHENIEEDGLVAREVRVQEEELRCVGQEADQEDHSRDCQAGESGVEHCCGGRRREWIVDRSSGGSGPGKSGPHLAVTDCHSETDDN